MLNVAPGNAEYITCQEATEFLTIGEGKSKRPISARRVLEFAMAGALRSARRKDAKRGNQMTTVVLRSDVLRLQHERENPPLEPAIPLPQKAPRALDEAPPSAPPKQRLLEAPAAPQSVWLTLDEAAKRPEGLPASVLERLIKSGKLPAMNVGIETVRYRIHVEDLAKLRGGNCADKAPAE
jgi:hypothetical protein